MIMANQNLASNQKKLNYEGYVNVTFMQMYDKLIFKNYKECFKFA